MAVRLGQIFYWIATMLTLSMGALAVAASILTLVMFAFVVYFLVFQYGIANWSSLGVGALFFAIIGGVWLMGNSVFEFIASFRTRSSRQLHRQLAKIILPWLGIAAFIGSLFFLFGE